MLNNANTTQKLIKGSISYEDLDFAKDNDQLIILGKGSFGIVYKGSYSGYTVAIKELKLPLLNTGSIKEFQKEVKAMKMAINPNIVGFYGNSIHNDTAYMIMEYLEGGSLRSLLNKKKTEEVSWPFRTQMATDVVEGLYYLHRNRILHRDIKADNILISSEGRAKLSDLGLACQSKHLSETISSIQSMGLGSAGSGHVGTIRWMAPEILMEYTYSDKSDLYAYGITLWEIASHRIPFAGQADFQVILKVDKGVRPEQIIIPEEYSYYQSIMEDSWQQNPKMRPAAKDVKQRFLKFTASLLSQLEYNHLTTAIALMASHNKADQQIEQEIIEIRSKTEQELSKAMEIKAQAELYAIEVQEKLRQEAINAEQKLAAKEQAAKKTIVRLKAKAKKEAKQIMAEAKATQLYAEQELAVITAAKEQAAKEIAEVKAHAEQEALADKNKAEQELVAAKAAQLQAEQAAALATPKLVSSGPHIAYLTPSNNQFTPSYSGQTTTTTTAASASVATPAVDQLQKFLQLIVEGEQDQAEAMLQQNQALALHAGNVTDLSGRSFNSITGFQYAVWALDWHMWKMILLNLPKDAARAQIKGMETGSWIATHGISASWQNLIDALDEFIRLCHETRLDETRWDDADNQWRRSVGDAQLLLPVHVVNEYCYPERPFDPCPDFKEIALPRSRKTDKGEWFTAKYNGGVLGMNCFAFCRSEVSSSVWVVSKMWRVYGWCGPCGLAGCDGCGLIDRTALDTLLKTRTQQRDQLFQDYAATTSKKFSFFGFL